MPRGRVKKTREAVGAKITAVQGQMVDALVKIATTTKSDALRASVARDLLDRGGTGEHLRRNSTQTVQFVMTAEAVKELARRKVEAGLPALEGVASLLEADESDA